MNALKSKSSRMAALGASPRRFGGLGRALAGIAVVASLGACAGGSAYLHNEKAAETSAKLKEKVDGIDLLQPIKTARETQATLNANYLDLVGQRLVAVRDNEIRIMVEAPTARPPMVFAQKAQERIEKRLMDVIGNGRPTDDFVSKAVQTWEAARTRDSTLAQFDSTWKRSIDDTPPSCTDLTVEKNEIPFKPFEAKAPDALADLIDTVFSKTEGQFERSVIEALVKSRANQCATYQNSSPSSVPFAENSLLNTAVTEMATAAADLEADKKKAKDTRRALKTAADALSAAQDAAKIDTAKCAKGDDPADGGGSEGSASESPEEQSPVQTQACVALKAIKDLKSIPTFGPLEAANEQIEKLDALLRAVTGESDDDDPTGFAATFVAFANHIDELKRLSAPPTIALVIQKKRLTILRDDAKRAVERAVDRVEILRKKRDALLREFIALNAARQLMEASLTESGGRWLTTDEMTAPRNPRARRYAVSGIETYLASIIGPRREAEAADYELVDLEHRKAIDANETAIRLQASLIKTAVSTLDENLQGGFRSEEGTQLLQSIILALIAVGVN